MGACVCFFLWGDVGPKPRYERAQMCHMPTQLKETADGKKWTAVVRVLLCVCAWQTSNVVLCCVKMRGMGVGV